MSGFDGLHCVLRPVLVLVLLACSVARAETAPSGLLVPRGVTYTYGLFTLTRELDVRDSSWRASSFVHVRERHRSRSKRAYDSLKTGRDDRTVSTSKRDDSLRDDVAGLGHTVGGWLGRALGPVGMVLGRVAGKFLGRAAGDWLSAETGLNEHSSQTSEQVTFRNALHHRTSFDQDDAQDYSYSREMGGEFHSEEHGTWHLKFEVEFRDETGAGLYRVEKPARIRVRGLSQPLPLDLPDNLEFGLEGAVCEFDYPVKDAALLRELQTAFGGGSGASSRTPLWIEIRPSDFKLVDVRTGENVLRKMIETERNTPTTEIALWFGDAGRLGPWCARQRTEDAAGGRSPTTLAQALQAVNVEVARNKAMPLRTFEFDGAGWTSVSDTPLARRRREGDDWTLLGIRLQRRDGSERILPVGPGVLDVQIRDYERIVFFEFSLARAVELAHFRPDAFAEMKSELLRFLKDGPVENGVAEWERRWNELEVRKETEVARVKPKPIPAGTVREVYLSEDVPMQFVYCSRGTDRGGFWMGRTEVTQVQWKRVMDSNPAAFRGAGSHVHPVEQVSWDDCQRYIGKIRDRTGVRMRLPTEEEWDLACRADAPGTDVPVGKLDELAWYAGNASERTHAVGRLRPNAWGLYDMQGNVLEWCSDVAEGVDAEGRILRGGGYVSQAEDCQHDSRDWLVRSQCDKVVGFRLVCDEL